MASTSNGTGNGDHLPNGRFAPGNRGGPGRPKRSVEWEYMAALGETVTLEDWTKIVQKAVEQAKEGDSTARAWLSRHVLGAEPPTLLRVHADQIARMGLGGVLMEAIVKVIKETNHQHKYDAEEFREAAEKVRRSLEGMLLHDGDDGTEEAGQE
jgi:hypothetical protein